jgi:transcriptional regulator with XRE-family HTH domain
VIPPAFSHPECATLPLRDRVVNVPRSKYLPSTNRGIRVPKEPTTIGGHLRRRRLQLKIYQWEAARRLGVSMVTLSRWERDTIYPTWAFQVRIVEYLGYDPFTNPALGRPKGNETTGVALLSQNQAVSIAVALRNHRLGLRKNTKEFAKELGVAVRTLRDWELGRHIPCRRFNQGVLGLLRCA